jgi:hypothetical protein
VGSVRLEGALPLRRSRQSRYTPPPPARTRPRHRDRDIGIASICLAPSGPVGNKYCNLIQNWSTTVTNLCSVSAQMTAGAPLLSKRLLGDRLNLLSE